MVQTTLQEVDLIVFSDEDCRNRHSNTIHPSHICGGVPEGGRGQCSGDSGQIFISLNSTVKKTRFFDEMILI